MTDQNPDALSQIIAEHGYAPHHLFRQNIDPIDALNLEYREAYGIADVVAHCNVRDLDTNPESSLHSTMNAIKVKLEMIYFLANRVDQQRRKAERESKELRAAAAKSKK